MDGAWYRSIPRDGHGYKYETTRDLYFHHDGIDPHLYLEVWSFDFCVQTIRTGIRIVHKGYRWDGATCAPDCVSVLMETVPHDVDCQCQFLPVYVELVATRKQADQWFAASLRRRGVKLWRLWYLGVRIGSLGKPTTHDGLVAVDLTPSH